MMLSRAINCVRSTPLRHIKFRNHRSVRNLFILSSMGRYRMVAAESVNPTPYKMSPIAMNYCNIVIIPVTEYSEVKDIPNHPEKLLIDVREPAEVEKGQIPSSINIPLGKIKEELSNKVSPEEFQEKYGRPKPRALTKIILYCREGQRAEKAAKIANSLGYKNVSNYEGSWLDWKKQEKIP